MYLRNDDAVAVWVGEKLYCMGCADDEDLACAEPEDYVLTERAERQGLIVFCDCEDHVGPRRLN